ncbi:MAG TPA: SGNH/GDSL hydrolase family protein [Chthoniobacter sp.]|jgi:hypothetical protein
MNLRILVALFAVALSFALTPAGAVDSANDGVRQGLLCVGDRPFPVPSGSEAIPVPGGDFEVTGKVPPGWDVSKGRVIAASDAPEGKSYVQLEAVNGGALRSPEMKATPGRPYFVSFWLKSPVPLWAMTTFNSDDRLRTATAQPMLLPATDNRWKRMGIFFWMPVPSTTVRFHIAYRLEAEQPGQFIGVDEVQIRSSTEAEMARAYEAERAHLPPFDTAPQAGDGSNLALSVAKWEGRKGIPGKPFVIWAIGSSWTEAQKDGYGMIYAIRKNFPKAPPIVYKEHDGAGTPWDYDASWVKQFVAAEQPDLIFTYTLGSPEGLDRLLTEIRKRTTADIIVPSIHFNIHSTLTPEDIENGTLWAQVREICRKHHAEFVEHRRDIAAYMKANAVSADDLLWDHVHQNLAGRIRVWDSVSRHLTDPQQFTYSPDSLERLVPVEPPAATATEQVSRSGNWTATAGALRTGEAGARLKVRFTGNRIDVIGRKLPGGGTVKVLIDGLPGDQAPAFAANYIKATPKIYPKKNVGGQPGDVAPQAVDLLSHLVPQSWTITMTSDKGDYELVGSVTGPDGNGNVTRSFTSTSGQIGIQPIDWRNGVLKPKAGEEHLPPQFGNVTGDRFDFDVSRSTIGTVHFAGAEASSFSEPLVENLSNQEHTLELIAVGDGPVEVDGLYVFQPMER